MSGKKHCRERSGMGAEAINARGDRCYFHVSSAGPSTLQQAMARVEMASEWFFTNMPFSLGRKIPQSISTFLLSMGREGKRPDIDIV